MRSLSRRSGISCGARSQRAVFALLRTPVNKAQASPGVATRHARVRALLVDSLPLLGGDLDDGVAPFVAAFGEAVGFDDLVQGKTAVDYSAQFSGFDQILEDNVIALEAVGHAPDDFSGSRQRGPPAAQQAAEHVEDLARSADLHVCSAAFERAQAA